MQAVGVTAIDSMNTAEVPNTVHDIALLNFKVRASILPGFRLKEINSKKSSLSHSLNMSIPKKSSENSVLSHWDEFKVCFWLYKFRLVLKPTNLTWLHTCRKDSHKSAIMIGSFKLLF